VNITSAAGTFDISGTTAGATITTLSGVANSNVVLGGETLTLSNASSTYSGIISGTGGALTLTSGSETLIGTNTYTGATTINGGTLALTGSIATSSLTTVNSSGTVTGTGTVGNIRVNSGGTFAPGTAPGTSMNVSDNLAFQSGAIYLVQVNPSSATSANVTGAAMLAGNVLAAFAPGTYLANQYDILHATGLGGTMFGALGTTNLPANFTANLSYTGTDVLLNLTATMGKPSGPSSLGSGLNINQQNVATSLNHFFNGGGTLTPKFLTVFGLTGGNLANALSQLSGEAATDAEKGSFEMMSQFFGLMLDPFVDGRGCGGASDTRREPLTNIPDCTNGTAQGFAPDQQASFPPDIALAYASVFKAPPPAPFNQRWTAWGSGFGASSTTNGNALVGSNNVTARDYGFAGGMDYHATPDTVYGFALAGGGTNWAWRKGSALVAAIPSRPVSMVRTILVQPTSPLRSPSPTTGLRPTAQRLVISSARALMGRATAADSKPGTVTASRQMVALSASRPMRQCRRNGSTRQATAKSI
jgi:autotransporter-associated beta strand protein